MHRLSGILLIGAVLATSGRAALPNLQRDAMEYLAKEWMDPGGASHCLKALGLYTADAAGNAAAALRELDTGQTPLVRETYAVASLDLEFPVWLATASPSYSKSEESSMFPHAGELIGEIYHHPGGKTALLAAYQDCSAAHPLRALYDLLGAVAAGGGEQVGGNMQLLRACYKLDRDRLLKSVAEVFQAGT